LLPAWVNDSRAQSEALGAQIREALQSNTASAHIMKAALEQNEQSFAGALDSSNRLASKLDEVIRSTLVQQAVHKGPTLGAMAESGAASPEAIDHSLLEGAKS